MIAIDLSKQQALNADPRAIQKNNFMANLDRAGYTAMFFIIEEANETVLDFSQGAVKVLWVQLNAISLSDLIINKMRQYKSLNVKPSNQSQQ